MRMNRKISRQFIAVVFLAASFSAAAIRAYAAVPESSSGQFPSIPATSLNNTKLQLPQEFAGKLNLVIISFAREQQEEVDTWIPLAKQIQAAHPNFGYYELPTMAWENIFYRWWFDSALRSNTTDPELRSRILTAYVGKSKFRKSLDIPNEKQIVILLVDKTGKIYWRASGPSTNADKAALMAALSTAGI